jgi:ABC-type nitrate/sulfonate/bicarbonate transport system substrate-binding protein
MKLRNRLMWPLIMVSILLFAGRALAAQAPITLTLVVDAVAAAKTPLYIAKEQNLFRKHGLEARVVSIGGATLAIQAGIGGDADVLDADEGSVILSALQAGPRLKVIGSLVNTFPFKVVGKPDLVQSPGGGRYGISRFGSPSDFSMRLFAKAKGLNPDKDIRILQVGGQPDRLAALQSGVIDASVFQEPEASMMISKGFKLIHDFSVKPIPYPFTGFSASLPALQHKRPAVIQYLKTMTEALHIYKCDKKTAIAAMSKGLRTTRSLNEAYDMILGYYPKDISPNRDALKAAVAVFGEVRPDLGERARTFDIDSVVDYTLMQEVLADSAMKPFLGACRS